MAETKPSGVPMIDAPGAIVSQEVAHIDKKGCLNLLQRWTKRLAWFPSHPEDFEVLLIFLSPGRLSIRDFANDGARIQQRYNELSAETDAETLEVLRLMQDRYGRLRVPKSRRASLGDPALAHLELERGQRSTIYVAIFPNYIDLLSLRYRNEKLIAYQEQIDDLPFVDF
jgi:hypothetical protein